MKRVISFLALMGSMGTLVCCFLPAVFVMLGFGAAFAGLIGNFPQLIWVSQHKRGLFLGAAILLVTAGVLHWRARGATCPIDPQQAAACRTGKDLSKWMFSAAILAFSIGSLFAFVIPWLRGL